MKWAQEKVRERKPRSWRLGVLALEEARREMAEPDATDPKELPASLPGASGWMVDETLAGGQGRLQS